MSFSSYNSSVYSTTHRVYLLVALLSLSLQTFQARQITSRRTDGLIAKISMENMTPRPPSSDERPLVLLAHPLFPDFAAALAGRFRFALAADAADTAEGRVLLVGLKPVTDEHLAGFPALELVVASLWASTTSILPPAGAVGSA
jgi:hypothetical protein